MARIVALFKSYDEAHRSAQALIRHGYPARVTYLLEEIDRSHSGREAFYPKVEREDRIPSGLEVAERPRMIVSPAVVLAGDDARAEPPNLEERLRGLGLADGQIHRILARVSDGSVAAIFRIDDSGERVMALLAEHGALAVEQVC